MPYTLPRRSALAGALCTGLTVPAWAAELAGVHVPDTYQVDGQSLVLNGYGLRTISFLRIKLYVAALYLPRKSFDPQAIMASPGPKVVVMHFLRGGSREQVQSRYREGEMDNCGDGHCDRSLEAEFERLVAAAPAVQPGDSLAYYISDKGLRVSFNGGVPTVYPGSGLAKLMLESFIGPHPPTPELRANLLGLLKP
ncbi:chalcone isomerase family protein [Rhodopila sp.]|uniref:chalcone isomerase family protein n=1 Tax=Rhodopila sp. TaxID=2480087 RepID=UPI002C6A4BF4|nr:chalcone isomerase family protein [Rhodopila sp.]HVZ09270.1 chalcone isomerase family protein [Rhodopila sp.]